MRTGRPAKASTIYRVSIHNNGGRRYASTQPYTVDEDGKKHYTHKHWGIVDDNLRFHPNSTYLYASLEERRKLIFPSGWDLSEIKTLSGTGHRGAVEYSGGDMDRMYGPTWFLDNVAKATGLLDDLQKVFGCSEVTLRWPRMCSRSHITCSLIAEPTPTSRSGNAW